ncbi:MAG TPA: DUF6600 domain-containing protein [Anaeromyxobacteraceae bacterium]|nr:DUF6600 domain-containing protein [Anaeromyxobacteraceae bacterium]
MRRTIATLALTALASIPPARGDDYQPPPPPEQPQVDVSVDMGTPGAQVTFETFQQALAPYGQWINVSPYGMVWRPSVPAGWRPYYYGHWAWTNEGWLWISDEPWGWGPYHYGRWLFDASWGWLWVPGYQWAPAWVSWRYSAEAVGWAPLAPGVSIYFSGFPAVYAAWTFVPCQSFVGVPIHSVAYAPAYATTYYQRTVPAPPRAAAYGHTGPAWGGPAHGFVEQRSGRAIPPTPIVPVGSPSQVRPGRGSGPVTVFRPPAPSPPSAAPGGTGTHPGWGSTRSPGWGPPGRVPAPGAAPGSRPRDNQPGWGTPPSRGPPPVAPGPRAPAPSPAPGRAGPPAQGWGSPGGGRGQPPAVAPQGGRGQPPAAQPQGGRSQPPAAAPRGGQAQPRGGSASPPAQRGGGHQGHGGGSQGRGNGPRH